MKIKEAEQFAQDKLKEHKLDDWEFRFMKRVTCFRSAGSCNYTYKQIKLQPVFVEMNDEEVVKNTILHEIAHALVPPNCHHNRIWKKKAIEIGCNGRRCYGGEVKKYVKGLI